MCFILLDRSTYVLLLGLFFLLHLWDLNVAGSWAMPTWLYKCSLQPAIYLNFSPGVTGSFGGNCKKKKVHLVKGRKNTSPRSAQVEKPSVAASKSNIFFYLSDTMCGIPIIRGWICSEHAGRAEPMCWRQRVAILFFRSNEMCSPCSHSEGGGHNSKIPERVSYNGYKMGLATIMKTEAYIEYGTLVPPCDLRGWKGCVY